MIHAPGRKGTGNNDAFDLLFSLDGQDGQDNRLREQEQRKQSILFKSVDSFVSSARAMSPLRVKSRSTA